MSYLSNASGDADAMCGSFGSKDAPGGTGSSREWRVDLREVGARLNVRVSHLLDGMRATGSLPSTYDTPAGAILSYNSCGGPLAPGASDCGASSIARSQAATGEGPGSLRLSSAGSTTPRFVTERIPVRNMPVPSTSSRTIDYNSAVVTGYSPASRPVLSYDPQTGSLSIHRSSFSPVDDSQGAYDSESCSYDVADRDPPTPAIGPHVHTEDDALLLSERQGLPSTSPPPKPRKSVGFLTFEGKPIESVYLYEATDQEALVLDVSYARPKWAWVCLVLVNGLLAYAAYDIQKMEKESALSSNIAPPVLAWWTSIGQVLLLAFLFPCMWQPASGDRQFVRTWRGAGMLVLLGVAMALERALAQVALDYTSNKQGGDVPAHIANTQETVMLLVGRAFMRQRVICTEVGSALTALIGMGLMMGSALHDGSSPNVIVGVAIGVGSSVFSAIELVLAHKMRNSVPLIVLMFLSQLISSVIHFPLALIWGASVSDIFNEVPTYTEWRYCTAVAALSLGNLFLIHLLSFLHPVTVSLAISAQLVIVLTFVEDNDSLLSAGYLVGVTLLLTSSVWGSIMSAKARRDVSFEVDLK